jgi:dCTP deaminase
LLSAEQIVDAFRADPEDRLTVVPAPDEAILLERGATSIDLRLGRWFRSFRQTSTKSVSLVALPPGERAGAAQESPTKQHFVPFGGSYVLHPGRFVLGVTLEWLHLPRSMSGYVTGKSSLGRHGLVIETAAGLHPMFSGCLTLELANVGEVPLEIYPGMEICQIFLHRTPACGAKNGGRFSGRRKPMLKAPSSDAIFDRLKEVPAALPEPGA